MIHPHILTINIQNAIHTILGYRTFKHNQLTTFKTFVNVNFKVQLKIVKFTQKSAFTCSFKLIRLWLLFKIKKQLQCLKYTVSVFDYWLYYWWMLKTFNIQQHCLNFTESSKGKIISIHLVDSLSYKFTIKIWPGFRCLRA